MSAYSKKKEYYPNLSCFNNNELLNIAIDMGGNLELDQVHKDEELVTIIKKIREGLPLLKSNWLRSKKAELLEICSNANLNYSPTETKDELINKIRLAYGLKKREYNVKKQRKKKKKTNKKKPKETSKKKIKEASKKKPKKASKKKSSVKKFPSIEVDNNGDNISVISDKVNHDDNSSLISSEVAESKFEQKKSHSPIKREYRKDHSDKKSELTQRDGSTCQGSPCICPYPCLDEYLEKMKVAFKEKYPNRNFCDILLKLIELWCKGLQIDHIREWNDSKDDSFENLQLLCTVCHKHKTKHYNSNKNLSFE